MKIEDVAYLVAAETLELLERKYHYRIADEHKKDVQSSVRSSLSRLMKEAQEKKGA